MKRPLIRFLVVTMCVVLPAPAMAIGLINEDQIRYEVVVEDSGHTRTHILRPGEALPDVCHRCDISVEGVGSISAQPDDTIVIRRRSFQVVS